MQAQRAETAAAIEPAAWLRHAAWPLWLERGIDRARGGFHESLDLRHHACAATFRRLRVVTRQVYVFSEAHRAGLAGSDAAVALGVEFLRRHAALPEGGYAWRFDLDNRVTDRRLDLYDHAFVLLALASASAVLPPARLRREALALLDLIETRFPHPAGGFVESLPPALPRRQNPHMHLLEALLAAFEAFGEEPFLDAAAGLGRLFADRLLQRETEAESGALAEYFDDGLRPQRIAGGFVVEPGHHCEWVWLLHRLRRLAGAEILPPGLESALMRFVDAHAVLPSGAIADEMLSDGTIRSSAARLWPQAERLKAEMLRPDLQPERVAQAEAALAAYLRPDGLWHERRAADGALSDEPAPASSLYHLTCAIVTMQARGAPDAHGDGIAAMKG
jgi:mannose-6-phosphate isomerase